MFAKRKEAARMRAFLEGKTPHLSAYEKDVSFRTSLRIEKKQRGLLALYSFAGSTVLAGVVALAVVLGVARPSFHPSYEKARPLARNKTSLVEESVNSVSPRSLAIYESYIANVVPLVFGHDMEKSKALSVVDAFVNFALNGYLSGPETFQAVQSLLDGASKAELKTAAKELILAIGTPVYLDDSSRGGFTLQSIWLDPSLPLKADISAIKQDLEESFYCSYFAAQPTPGEISKYFAANVPEDFPLLPATPEAPENATSAVVSSFFMLDKFKPDAVRKYKSEYESHAHYLNYETLEGNSLNVDYIQTQSTQKLHLNDHYIGADANICYDSFSYFLPDEKGIEPLKQTMTSVAQKGYTDVGPSEKDGNSAYLVHVLAPYFKISSQISLKQDYETALPGLGEKKDFLSELVDGDYYLLDTLQSSIVAFDYAGIYAASETISFGAGAAHPSGKDYTLTLDRPYVFRVNSPLVKIKGSLQWESLPLIYGTIITPDYPKA